MKPGLFLMGMSLVLCCAFDAAAGGKGPGPGLLDLDAAHNQAVDLYQSGHYAEALEQGKRARVLAETVPGSGAADVGRELNLLGVIHTALGNHALAEPLYLRALRLREQAMGRHHTDVAETLTNLAAFYVDRGLYARAEPLLQRALAILGETVGQDRPDTIIALTHLAQVRMAADRLAEALPLLSRAFSFSEQRLRQEALSFSELRLKYFLRHLRLQENTLYALLAAHPGNEDVRRLALSAVLLLKGRSVEELASTSRTVYRSLGQKDREAFEQLRALRGQYATLSLQGGGSRPLKDHQERLWELANAAAVIEDGLAGRSAPLRALRALPSPSEVGGQVAAALPPDGALIELVAYRNRPLFDAPGAAKSRPAPQLRYLALVLRPDGGVQALDLGAAEPIDRAASVLRDALANRAAGFEALSRAVYQRVFQPLLPLLGQARRLFVSPDGQLALVPFAALHDGERFLVDAYDFTYLTSGRELLPRAREAAPPTGVVVLADPDFSAPASSSSHTAPQVARPDSVDRFFTLARSGLESRAWTPLPGTRQEARFLQRLIPRAQVLLGPQASKERLLTQSTPAVLHIATHGFFLEDASAPEDSRAAAHFSTLGESSPAQQLPDPLLRSGLVLAGARAPASEGERPLEGALVTALELAGLDLWGTELVVLSACDTGRGEVQLGQGVHGMRRAFIAAGAETVVMSLWKVRDDSTRRLIHPHDWAPFIVLGRDGPVRALTAGAPRPPAP
jgi:CHAT domain-containing protein